MTRSTHFQMRSRLQMIQLLRSVAFPQSFENTGGCIQSFSASGTYHLQQHTVTYSNYIHFGYTQSDHLHMAKPRTAAWMRSRLKPMDFISFNSSKAWAAGVFSCGLAIQTISRQIQSCLHMYVCISKYIYIQTYVYVYVCVSVGRQAHVYTHYIYICTYTYVCIYYPFISIYKCG